jgi:hypothetical protein
MGRHAAVRTPPKRNLTPTRSTLLAWLAMIVVLLLCLGVFLYGLHTHPHPDKVSAPATSTAPTDPAPVS